ncbi:PREDICTED: cytochrome c oxidase assembly factor 3, mitochondrial [Nicrophorus vespilloides]|uniref:Cytochrome c oxidase assembly factor 3 n=1 Tax=Nicrophorus vespilloides TaxID=110193 RepID=A0ABM1N0I1_NICVS|nr:PREDICTED: cytochrome c oxidase assembly factor 3, mitochondrial [Nicrophorus vespilloides]
MSDKERMPSADISKLKQSDLDFMKYVESQNRERVEKLKLLRRNNIRTASVIGGAVIGIYLYSMLAVKQEKFLDDFDEPVKVIEKQ